MRPEKNKVTDDKALEDIRNLFRPEKDKRANEGEWRDIRNLYEPKEGYYKPIRTGNDFSSNYIEYENHGDKILSIKYLDKIEPYLNDLIDEHKTQGERKIQLTMTINFIFLLKILMKLVLCLQKVIT